MKTRFIFWIYLVSFSLVLSQSCDKEKIEPVTCIKFMENTFPWMGSTELYSNDYWLSSWPYKPVIEFNEDHTFYFEANYPCDSKYGLVLKCDSLNDVPFAPLRISGTYEVSYVIGDVELFHFGPSNALGGTIMLNILESNNNNNVSDSISVWYAISCRGDVYHNPPVVKYSVSKFRSIRFPVKLNDSISDYYSATIKYPN